MKISEKVIIVARSAGGKDYLASYLKSKGLKKSVMHTTRPIRDKEVNGETYHFITDDKFKQMIDSDEFYEWDNFIGWYYGSTKQDFT